MTLIGPISHLRIHALDSTLDHTGVLNTATQLANDSIRDNHIAWGLAAGEVSTTDMPEGTNLYYTNTRARASISETVTGLDYNNVTGVLSLTAGYVIITAVQEGNFTDAYNHITASGASHTFINQSVTTTASPSFAKLTITQTSTTGSALTVTRNLAAASTDSPVFILQQNNAGDDQPVLSITNAGAGNAISVTSYGNAGIAIDYYGNVASIYTNNLGTGWGLRVYSNVGATVTQPLVEFHVDNATFNKNVLDITNDGTGRGLYIDNNSANYALYIENTGSTGLALYIYSNQGAGQTQALVQFHAANAAFDQDVLQIINNGTETALYVDMRSTGRGLYIYSDVGATASQPLAEFKADNAAFGQHVLLIVNDGTAKGLYIDNNGTGLGLQIENTGGTGLALYIYSDQGGAQAAPLVRIYADNSTFDHPVVNIINDGSAEGLYVDTRGTGKGIFVDNNSTNFGVHIDNTQSNNIGLFVYSINDGTQAAALVEFHADHAGFDEPVLKIIQDGPNHAVYIDNNNNGSALYIENTGSAAQGILIMSDKSAAALPLVALYTGDAGFGQAVLAITQSDVSEGCIDFIASARGIITGATNSVQSVRVELNGTKYRLALFADA